MWEPGVEWPNQNSDIRPPLGAGTDVVVSYQEDSIGAKRSTTRDMRSLPLKKQRRLKDCVPDEIDDKPQSQEDYNNYNTLSLSTDSKDSKDLIECPICSYKYKGKSSFTAHLRKKHPETRNVMPCYVCNDDIDQQDFEKHFRAHQMYEMRQRRRNVFRWIQCANCTHSTQLKVDMIQHMATEHGQTQVQLMDTETEFLLKGKQEAAANARISDNDSEKTLSGSEREDDEREEVSKASVSSSAVQMKLDHGQLDLASCLKRGRDDLLSRGFVEVMLHHLNITAYERSWLKLLITNNCRYIRVPVEVDALASDAEQLSDFVIENEVPISLKKLFSEAAWTRLLKLVQTKRSRYTCCICNMVQKHKIYECLTCKRRYHTKCKTQGKPRPGTCQGCGL